MEKLDDGPLVAYYEDGTPCLEQDVGEVIARWDGYIAPDGAFYATKPSGVSYWKGCFSLHEEWAQERLGGELGGYKSAKDRLVFGEGWISCAFDLALGACVIVPDRTRVTEAQKLTLLRIYGARGLDPNCCFSLLGEKD